DLQLGNAFDFLCHSSISPGGANGRSPSHLVLPDTQYSVLRYSGLYAIPNAEYAIQNRLSSYTFSTCKKSSSTGVSRPKNETITRTLARSMSISATVPMKSLKGPSTMRTFWLGLKVTFTLGASASIRRRIWATSSGRSGVG